MENLINKIEKYQTNNSKEWNDLMQKDIKEMPKYMARLIGSMNYQLDSIKEELEILKNK